MTDDATPSLMSRLKPIMFVAWAVIALRFALEFTAPENARALPGIYYAMPLLLAWAGWRGQLDAFSYGRMVLGFLLLAVLCWTLPNLIVYSTAQFLGWEHGRFYPGTELPDGSIEGQFGPAIADSTGGKLLTATTVALLTTIAGFVWTFVWGTLVVYLPKRIRAKKQAAQA